MTITIDTSVINATEQIDEMNELEKLAKKGIITIVGTERLLIETTNHSLRKAKAKSYQNISEPNTIGFSGIGRAYIPRDKNIEFSEIASILFPLKKISELNENESNDVMHLIAHAYSNSDYFVTQNTNDFIHANKTNKNRNGSFKNFKKNQFQRLGIKVLTPKEMIEIVNNTMS